MNVLKLILALLLCSNLIIAQGFELIYGGNAGDNSLRKVFEIPNEDAYLAIDFGPTEESPEVTFNITKVDFNGNIVFSIPYDYQSFSAMDFLILDESFKIAFGDLANAHIIEFDYTGQVLSQIEYPVAANAYIEEVKFLSDHSVVFTELVPFIYNVTRLSPEGTLIWKKEDAFQGNIYKYDLKVLPNDEFLILTGGGDQETLYKFDQDGNLLWANDQVPNFFAVHAIISSPDSQTYLLYGDNSDIVGIGTYLAAFSFDGELIWVKDFSDHLNKIHSSGLIPGESNTYYATGIAYLDEGKATKLFQLDAEGNILWEKEYFFNADEGQLLRTSDDGFIIATETFPGPGFSSDPFVLKLDSAGEEVWTWHRERADRYFHYGTIRTTDGGYLIWGKGEALTDEDNDQNYLTKLDANGRVYTRQINGILAIDENQSCSYDPGEQGLSNWLIQVEGRQTFVQATDETGYFSIDCNADTVLLKAIPFNDLWEPCPLEVPVVFESLYDTSTVHLSMQAMDECPAIELDISTPFIRRCFENTYYVNVKNTGTVLAEDVHISIELDSFFILGAVSVPDYDFLDQLLTLSIGDLEVDQSVGFSFQVEVSCEAPLGQIHCVTASSDLQNDCTDNSSSTAFRYQSTIECQPNIGSFDPNDKMAFSGGNQTEQYILRDSIIEYQIRFQNTGTDTAFNVVIIDTLSEWLDLTTFQLGTSSHPVRFEIDRYRTVKFIFDNIMLPDSNINEAASHGLVKFKIRPASAFESGDVIANQAFIYFDFNDPIRTNQVQLELAPISSTSFAPLLTERYLNVFPQPASAVVNLSFLDDQKFHQGNFAIEVISVSGQVVLKKPIQSVTFHIEGLHEGIYFYRLFDVNKPRPLEIGKFIIANH